jgi:hypothetical protein
VTTLETNKLIEQIKYCQKMGALAPFYFETKIRELLALQWQLPYAQRNADNCCSCRYKAFLDFHDGLL